MYTQEQLLIGILVPGLFVVVLAVVLGGFVIYLLKNRPPRPVAGYQPIPGNDGRQAGGNGNGNGNGHGNGNGNGGGNRNGNN